MPGLVPRDRCPACDGANFGPIYECPYSDEALCSFLKSYYSKYDPSILKDEIFRVNQCSDCTLVFQGFVPDPEMLNVVYDTWIGLTPASKKPFSPSRKSRDAHELYSIAKYFSKPLDELSVFDYGMGLAKWCQTAQLMGCEVSGFDLAESRMEHAKSLGINVVQWDEFPNQQVDFVNTEQVFEHLVDPFESIEQLSKALGPGGVIKISVPFGKMKSRLEQPDWMAPKYTKKSLNPVLPLEHINCWTQKSVAALAKRIGMYPIKRSFFGDLAFLGKSSAVPRNPKELMRSLLRPAYKRWYPHKLYCWLAKP